MTVCPVRAAAYTGARDSAAARCSYGGQIIRRNIGQVLRVR
jgi:hypothetical protein